MVRIAIIGAGAVAEIHIQAFKTFPDRCEVRALADLYPEKAEKLAARHGISAVVCKDYREAVARDDVDLVSVCLPPSVHAEAAIAAFTLARRYTDDVQCSAEDATRSDFAFLCRVVEAVIEAGATTVNLPDTVGYSTPDEMQAFFEQILAAVFAGEFVPRICLDRPKDPVEVSCVD